MPIVPPDPAGSSSPNGLLRTLWSFVTHSRAGFVGALFLTLTFAACYLSLPWTLGHDRAAGGARESFGQSSARYEHQERGASRLPPAWWAHDAAQRAQREALDERARAAVSTGEPPPPTLFLLGADTLGRDLFARLLLGGALSLTIGVLAAAVSVVVGTLYGAIAGWVGGRTDAVMMRIVDVLYGLPYVLLVVLIAVAVDALIDARRAAGSEWTAGQVQAVNIVTLLVAIGGVSWLTMARVVRGQVLSLRERPFIESARAVGVGPWRLFARHLLPNLAGPIIVYATLIVPQAILQESFLSFLGLGIKPPLPTWGTLAADGLSELNTVRSRWWLLLFPCLMLGGTLLALNFLGEGLRAALDPNARRPWTEGPAQPTGAADTREAA